MPKTVQQSAIESRKGVSLVQQLVATELGWLFREQPTDDYGIDAQMELVVDNAATGRLIAVQIKSGSSYFDKQHADGWVLTLDENDLEYWLKHSLPVIVVLCDTVASRVYWEVVNEEHIVTGPRGGKKILIRSAKRFGDHSVSELKTVAQGKPYELRIRQLRLALPWMKLLQDGRRILLEASEWVNKSSGRGDIEIVSVDDASEDRESLGGWFIMVGNRPYEEVLPSLVPWANVVLHEETYDDADYDAWEEECVQYDSDGDRWESEPYQVWKQKYQDQNLRPYGNGAGEVDFWRLELVLNDLGKGFLSVDKFAENESFALPPLPA